MHLRWHFFITWNRWDTTNFKISERKTTSYRYFPHIQLPRTWSHNFIDIEQEMWIWYQKVLQLFLFYKLRICRIKRSNSIDEGRYFTSKPCGCINFHLFYALCNYLKSQQSIEKIIVNIASNNMSSHKFLLPSSNNKKLFYILFLKNSIRIYSIVKSI